MLKVSDIATLELAKFMYRYHKFKVPNLFITENYFTPIDEIQSYNTRSSSSKCYFLPSVNTSAGRISLLFRGTKLWNVILVDIKVTISISQICQILQELSNSQISKLVIYFIAPNYP